MLQRSGSVRKTYRHAGLVSVRDTKCIHDEDLCACGLCEGFSKRVIIFGVTLIKRTGKGQQLFLELLTYSAHH